MIDRNYILITQYSEYSKIDNSFLENLFEYGLIRFEKEENAIYINEDDIPEIERLYRLHQDLGINFEGLDAIKHMLRRLEKMEKKMNLLQKKINLYE